jgi:hypothetical protein
MTNTYFAGMSTHRVRSFPGPCPHLVHVLSAVLVLGVFYLMEQAFHNKQGASCVSCMLLLRRLRPILFGIVLRSGTGACAHK